MKPRVKMKVQFGKPTRPTPTAATEPVPRAARLLALAHAIDERIRAGEIEDFADAARELGLTRARVTQLMNLLLLAPEIQISILANPPPICGREPITERSLRLIVAEPGWRDQLGRWEPIAHRRIPA